MNTRNKVYLSLMVCLAIGLCTGAADAQQLTVAVTTSGTQTTSPGSSVNAGVFTITNGYSTNITVTQVQLSIGNPNLFSSMTMTATGSDNTSQSISVPLQTTSTITFASPVPLNVNQPAASFGLTATIAGGGATATPVSGIDSMAFASIIWPAKSASKIFLTMLSLLAVGMLWMDGRLRPRHLVVLLLALVLAASEVGCGNCSGSLFGCGGSNTGTGSSDQQITQLATNPGNLNITYTSPAPDLGTITSQN